VVRAEDAIGQESGDSSEVNATPADPVPSAPTGLNAVAGDAQVTLDWVDNAEGDLAGYNVYRSTTSGGSYQKLNTSGLVTVSDYVDNSASNGVTYFYVVRAEDAIGQESGDSSEVSATPVDPVPAAPTGLNAVADDNQVSLDWADNAEGDLAGYNVYRSDSTGGPYQKLNTGGLVAVSDYLDSSAVNDATYYYVVTAQDLAGQESGNSAEVQILVTTAPATQVYLTFQDPVTLGSSNLLVENEDIVAFDGADFQMFFDGSDVGITAMQLDAIQVLSATEILMSFSQDGSVPGIALVEDTDIVRFTATSLGANTSGAFDLYFHGRSVLLTSNDEDVDGVEILSDGRLLVSTRGVFAVQDASGGVIAGDGKDLIAFTPTAPLGGGTTAGSWEMYFDGTDVDLTLNKEDVTGVSVDSSGSIYLTTVSTFSVTGVSGNREDIFVFNPTSLGEVTTGTYSPQRWFDGSLYGLSGINIMGLDLP
ncbi:MAG: fibronectin type III domain-containing protein, partial [Dehalococcoidia bacterium]